ncbi:MAG TPA: hypothetical protein VMF10_06575 [Candidatus Aquilonibacter sp.]|nr:hypothetical protein [Candidatus Aquilonibacter sp.]
MVAPSNEVGLGKHRANRLSYGKWLPNYVWQKLSRSMPRGRVHLIFALADHFEPAFMLGNGVAEAVLAEQERRVEAWCTEYPRAVDAWRDHEGRRFTHTYFFPAEQYDRGLVDRLAQHCHAGWGEIEIHLHHGIDAPDTAENTQHMIERFRDTLVRNHCALSFMDGSSEPRYAFVHGNFALANSADGYACGVDNEMEILARTGCYADFSLPTATFHPAQIAKINSLYECGLPLHERAPHRRGTNLRVGRPPQLFPLQVQGPLMLDFHRHARNHIGRIENAALTGVNPPSLRRHELWKKAAISVQHRPDWLFIKLHCHSMDPAQRESVMGGHMQKFLSELIGGAQSRDEVIHFVTAREMVNIILAACDGREGNPGDYRDYRLKLAGRAPTAQHDTKSQMSFRG